MASSKDYLNYVLLHLPEEGFRFRAVMGEYIMYYNIKVWNSRSK